MLQCPVSRNFAVNGTYPGPVVFQASPFLKGGDLEKRLFSGVHVPTPIMQHSMVNMQIQIHVKNTTNLFVYADSFHHNRRPTPQSYGNGVFPWCPSSLKNNRKDRQRHVPPLTMGKLEATPWRNGRLDALWPTADLTLFSLASHWVLSDEVALDRSAYIYAQEWLESGSELT